MFFLYTEKKTNKTENKNKKKNNKNMKPIVWIKVSKDGKMSYYKKTSSGTYHIDEEDFLKYSKEQDSDDNNDTTGHKNTKFFVVAVHNNMTNTLHKTYFKRVNNDTYELEASDFLDDTMYSNNDLQTLFDTLHDHHIHNISIPKSLQTSYTPSYPLITPAYQVVIPVNTRSRRKCFEKSKIASAKKTKSLAVQGDDKGKLNDTYKACLSGSCKYALTVKIWSKKEYDAIINIEKTLSDVRPTLVDSWRCDDDGAEMYFLHKMVDGEIGDCTKFNDELKKDIAAKLRKMMTSIHAKRVTLGGNIDGTTILYSGDNNPANLKLYVGDISAAAKFNTNGELDKDTGFLTLESDKKDLTLTSSVSKDNTIMEKFIDDYLKVTP